MGWRRFWQRKRRDQELKLEIESYLAHEADLQAAQGLAAEEAGWAARRKLGNRLTINEKVWEMNTLGLLESIWQDLRYAARVLRMNPGFFAVATISLALGIGANTAIFQLLDAVRLRLLPVKDPQQLVEVQIADNPHCCNGHFFGRRSNLTSAQWEQIRAQQRAFENIFAWGNEEFNLKQSGEVQLAQGLWVTGDYFKTLGVTALLGRLVDDADDRPGCGAPGAVISYAFWQRHFGGDAGALAKTLLLNGRRFGVIGVTPASFFGVEVGKNFDVILPACAQPMFAREDAHSKHRDHWWLAVMGRLKPGWTIHHAEAQLQAISPAVFESSIPENYRPQEAKYYGELKLAATPAGSGTSDLREKYQSPLLLLMGIAGLVLLIACANLANLTLARASAREREMAVRLAMGAGRGRLIRQLLAESLLLTVGGAAMGALLAELLCRYMVAFLTTERNPVFLPLSADWRLLGFTASVAILTCLLFGLTPALRATRTAPVTAMKAAGRGLTAGRERFSLRRTLVVGQVALSLVLLAAALLFVRSLRNLTSLDAGLQQEGLLIMTGDVSRLNYTAEQRSEVYRRLLEQVRNTPGVDEAATATVIPLSGNSSNDQIEIPGVASRGEMLSWFSSVSGGYFRTAGMPLLGGRDFDEHDTISGPGVAIVNQEFCRKFLGGANPLGKQIRVLTGPGEAERQYQIVGLVKNARYQSLREVLKPVTFIAQSQNKVPRPVMKLLVRSRLAGGPLTAALKRAAEQTNAEMSIQFVAFQTQVQDSLLRDRLMATLSAFFGFLAALLATVGLYGVISYMVARRRSEIGIRIALGATRSGVLRLIMQEAALLLIAGLVVGMGLALLSGKAAETLLFGLKPSDPATMTMAISLLATVALGASFVPALRAARTEPSAVLREE